MVEHSSDKAATIVQFYLGLQFNKYKYNKMKTTLSELIEQLKNSTNPVTDWSLRECIVARLKNKDFDDAKV